MMGGLSDLGRLLAERGVVLPEGTPAAAAEAPAASGSNAFSWSSVSRAVLQRTRAGRGGKTVTIVRGIDDAHLTDAARALKKALGVGATVEEGGVVVQGDQVDRLRAWLSKAGVRRVVGE